MKRIGEVPSPWPCFAIIATNKALAEFGDLIIRLRDMVYQESLSLQTSATAIEAISEKYELNAADVKAWFAQTSWALNSEISKSQLDKSMTTMKELGIISDIVPLEDFLLLEKLLIID